MALLPRAEKIHQLIGRELKERERAIQVDKLGKMKFELIFCSGKVVVTYSASSQTDHAGSIDAAG
jgi:hypothetical protein